MKKILAFGASNSSQSINQEFAIWAANQVKGADVTAVRLGDFEMPIYGIDKEKATGIPQLAIDFKTLVNDSDGIIISFAEHNGAFTVAFKNVYDWISRIGKPIWGDKPMLMLATSPGARGGASVLKTAQEILPYRGAKIAGTFSLPSFEENFSEGIAASELARDFKTQLSLFENTIDKELELTT